MTPDYSLHYAPDNASLIIRLALEEMGLPYRTVLVDRPTNAHKSPEYRKLNPAGLIPVLETPNGPIFETGAILLWLADQHECLAPAVHSQDRAGFLKWLFYTSNTVHAGMRMLFYPEQFVGPDRVCQTELQSHMQGELRRHLSVLDTLAAERQSWFCANTTSVLDLYVACLLRWMALYPKNGTSWFNLADWPHLQALAARLETCASIQRAIDAEGLGPAPLTAPRYANPPEGSAT